MPDFKSWAFFLGIIDSNFIIFTKIKSYVNSNSRKKFAVFHRPRKSIWRS